MSEKRKKALVAYLAGLFGVAFLIVSFSLGVQLKKNTLNATSAEKVVALQDEIQQLKTENKELENSVDYLKTNLSEVLEGLEFLEGNAHEATAHIQRQERLLEINSCLISYQQAVIAQDEEAIAICLEELKLTAEDAETLDPQLYETIQVIINENESETD